MLALKIKTAYKKHIQSLFIFNITIKIEMLKTYLHSLKNYPKA